MLACPKGLIGGFRRQRRKTKKKGSDKFITTNNQTHYSRFLFSFLLAESGNRTRDLLTRDGAHCHCAMGTDQFDLYWLVQESGNRQKQIFEAFLNFERTKKSGKLNFRGE